MRDFLPHGTMWGMSSGRHKVIIELGASHGPPQGTIGVDGGPQQGFFGWIDLTARLEELLPEPAAAHLAGPIRTRGSSAA
jgi:hypothetical protein